jgi:hypothetical protein
MNLQTYRQLIRFAGFSNHKSAHNERLRLEGPAMSIILNSPLNNSDDLVRMIHMVYAWMPKMLRSFNDNISVVDINRLFRLAAKARSQTITQNGEYELFEGLAMLTNNYMVGASKVLTILNSEVYPIFDSRVVTSWNAFFKEESHWPVKELGNLRVNNQQAMINNYRHYQTTLQSWASRIHRNIRDIEFLFWIAR